MNKKKYIHKVFFKKIKFINLKHTDFKYIINKHGLFLFPSGPGLATINKNNEYYKSLLKADYVFFDSGYFVLLLKILKKIKAEKFSGYKFLQLLFFYFKKNNNCKIFTIDPSKRSSILNKKYLKKLGLKSINSYIAPKYNSKTFMDKMLIKKIDFYKPDFVLINLGGGVQEILGMTLKKKLKMKSKILCTGAAISYFTGEQAPINKFFDNMYLGWLIRIIYQPSIFLTRYLNSFKLIYNVILENVTEVNKYK